MQQRLKNNKKAPAMHRSEDDYLLTTRLFCGKCGAMMVGEIGTSHTQSKYRYYKCNQAKKHKCDKKAVKKDWIEDLIIEELSDRIYEMQTEENTAVAVIRNQLSEVEKKLNNLAEAIAQGVFSSTTKKLLDDLEEQKSNLEVELFQTQINHPVFTKEQIQFALYSYRKLDLSSQEGRQQLIDGFVNSIFLYDDRFLITFNYKGQNKTVTLEQVNSSSLTSKGSPTTAKHGILYFFAAVNDEERVKTKKETERREARQVRGGGAFLRGFGVIRCYSLLFVVICFLFSVFACFRIEF